MERIEVFRINPEFDNSKCYEYAEATKQEGGSQNRRYYTDKQPLYVGHLVDREQGGFGDGGWQRDTFEDDTGKKHIVNYSYEGNTCFREVPCKSVRSLESLAREVVKKNYEYLSLPKDDDLRVLIEEGSLPQYNPEEESFYRQQSASNGWSGAGTSRGAGGVDTTAGVSGTSNTGGGAGPSENGAADSKKDFKGGRRSNKTKSTKKQKEVKKRKAVKKQKEVIKRKAVKKQKEVIKRKEIINQEMQKVLFFQNVYIMMNMTHCLQIYLVLILHQIQHLLILEGKGLSDFYILKIIKVTVQKLPKLINLNKIIHQILIAKK